MLEEMKRVQLFLGRYHPYFNSEPYESVLCYQHKKTLVGACGTGSKHCLLKGVGIEFKAEGYSSDQYYQPDA